MPAVHQASSTVRSSPRRAACCSRSTTTMKAENSRPKMRPFHAARAVFPTGRDSPSDCLERYLETLAELEPDVGAFVNLNLEGAREAAARSTARWRDLDPLSLLDGMPVGIKDIVDTVNIPTEMGSPLFKACRSERDAATAADL